MALQIPIARGQRVAFIGLPESGKTNLEMAMLEDQGSVVIFDGKHDPQEWVQYGRRRGYLITSDPEQIRTAPRVVYEVPSLGVDDRQGWDRPGRQGYAWTLALLRTFERGARGRQPTIVVFADSLRLLPSSGANPQARRIFTEGRSLGLTVFFDIQQARWVDTMAIKTSEHCFCARMRDADTLKHIHGLRMVEVGMLAELERFHFAYHRMGQEQWTLMAPVQKVQ